MSRKRRGSYDVGYMRIVVGLIRDGIGAGSLARRLGVSGETTREWLLSYRIGGEAALMGERGGNGKYDYETKLAAVLDHPERGMSRPKGAKSKPKPAPIRERLLEEENACLKARVACLGKVDALLASKSPTGRNRRSSRRWRGSTIRSGAC